MSAQEFKRLRLDLKLSQREFGELLGYTEPQTRISEIENNKKIASNQAIAACKLLQENMELKKTIEELKKILSKA